eukprot:NODE_117_length_18986_cov_0.639540.p12 type:complete len:123 gc:universal NODE_117_length_18986_cov_0.639540:3417-3049(-)
MRSGTNLYYCIGLVSPKQKITKLKVYLSKTVIIRKGGILKNTNSHIRTFKSEYNTHSRIDQVFRDIPLNPNNENIGLLRKVSFPLDNIIQLLTITTAEHTKSPSNANKIDLCILKREFNLEE